MTGTPAKTRRTPRPIAALLALLLVPLAAGLYLAPHVYNILRILVKHHPWFHGLHPLEFQRVANRCCLAVALLLLAPMLRRSGLGRDIRAAVRPAGRGGILAGATAIGVISMGALYLVGLALGGYRLDLQNDLTAWFLARAVAGALLIGVFEEAFFRGFVFGALRTRLRDGWAAVVASAFFSAMHFAQPFGVRPPRWAEWDEGARLLGLAFNGFQPMRDGPFAITLFLMGLTLCQLYRRQGHLAWCIGLHAGWVLAMQVGNQLFDRNFDRLVWLFTQSGFVGQSLLALPVMAAFLAWAATRPDVAGPPPRRGPVL